MCLYCSLPLDQSWKWGGQVNQFDGSLAATIGNQLDVLISSLRSRKGEQWVSATKT
jgi:hypothetical protein